MLRNAKRKIGRADLGYGESACRNHHLTRKYFAARSANAKALGIFGYSFHLHGPHPAHTTEITFGFEHGNNVFGRPVAKQLPLVLLMERNVVTLDQPNEVLWRITRQSATTKMWILRQKILRAGIDIGEIAATTTGDTNFFSQLFCVIDQHHTFTALPSDTGAHHARSTCADHCDIHDLAHCALLVFV